MMTFLVSSCATIRTDITSPDGSKCCAEGTSLFMDVSKVKMKGCGAYMSADGAGVDDAALLSILKVLGTALSVPTTK